MLDTSRVSLLSPATCVCVCVCMYRCVCVSPRALKMHHYPDAYRPFIMSSMNLTLLPSNTTHRDTLLAERNRRLCTGPGESARVCACVCVLICLCVYVWVGGCDYVTVSGWLAVCLFVCLTVPPNVCVCVSFSLSLSLCGCVCVLDCVFVLCEKMSVRGSVFTHVCMLSRLHPSGRERGYRRVLHHTLFRILTERKLFSSSLIIPSITDLAAFFRPSAACQRAARYGLI